MIAKICPAPDPVLTRTTQLLIKHEPQTISMFSEQLTLSWLKGKPMLMYDCIYIKHIHPSSAIGTNLNIHIEMIQ